MKSLILIILTLLTGYLPAQESISVRYNEDKHLLTVNAQDASISSFIDALSKEGFQLYFADLEKDFKLSGNFTDQPVDEVLDKIIPNQYHYFYRISDKAEKILQGQTATSKHQSLSVKQDGDKLQGRPGPVTVLVNPTQLQNLSSKLRIKPNVTNRDDALGNQQPRIGGSASMTVAANIKAGLPLSPDKEEIIGPPAIIAEHLVVTFRITNSEIIPVGASYEAGAYKDPHENSIRSDYALIGSESDNVVLLEPIENPLEARSIFDPEQKIEHGSFKQESALVTVKMPKKYDQLINSNKIKLQFGKISEKSRENLFLNKKLNRLKVSDLNNLFETKLSALKLDLKNIRIQKRK